MAYKILRNNKILHETRSAERAADTAHVAAATSAPTPTAATRAIRQRAVHRSNPVAAPAVTRKQAAAKRAADYPARDSVRGTCDRQSR